MVVTHFYPESQRSVTPHKCQVFNDYRCENLSPIKAFPSSQGTPTEMHPHVKTMTSSTMAQSASPLQSSYGQSLKNSVSLISDSVQRAIPFSNEVFPMAVFPSSHQFSKPFAYNGYEGVSLLSPSLDSVEATRGASQSTSAEAKIDQFFKTKMCIPYTRGQCKRGFQCCFAHGIEELNSRLDLQKTKLCQLFEKGQCQNTNCYFAHGAAELKATGDYYKTGLCKFWKRGLACEAGQDCRHAHGHHELRLRTYRRTERDKRESHAPKVGKARTATSDLSRVSSQQSLLAVSQPILSLEAINFTPKVQQPELSNAEPPSSQSESSQKRMLSPVMTTTNLLPPIGAQVIKQASLSPFGSAVPFGGSHEVGSMSLGQSAVSRPEQGTFSHSLVVDPTTAAAATSAIQRVLQSVGGSDENALVAASQRQYYMSNDSILSLDHDMCISPDESDINQDLGVMLSGSTNSLLHLDMESDLDDGTRSASHVHLYHQSQLTSSASSSIMGLSREGSGTHFVVEAAGLTNVDSQVSFGTPNWDTLKGVPSAPCIMTHHHQATRRRKGGSGTLLGVDSSILIEEHEEDDGSGEVRVSRPATFNEPSHPPTAVLKFVTSSVEQQLRSEKAPFTMIFDGKTVTGNLYVDDVLIDYKKFEQMVKNRGGSGASILSEKVAHQSEEKKTSQKFESLCNKLVDSGEKTETSGMTELSNLVAKILLSSNKEVQRSEQSVSTSAEILANLEKVLEQSSHSKTSYEASVSSSIKEASYDSDLLKLIQKVLDAENQEPHLHTPRRHTISQLQTSNTISAQLALQDEIVDILGYDTYPDVSGIHTYQCPSSSSALQLHSSKYGSSSASLLFGNPQFQDTPENHPCGVSIRDNAYGSVPNLCALQKAIPNAKASLKKYTFSGKNISDTLTNSLSTLKNNCSTHQQMVQKTTNHQSQISSDTTAAVVIGQCEEQLLNVS